jgi:hypothetical protein
MAGDEPSAASRNYYALAGLILGIVGILFYTIGIISLLAVILSLIGLSKAKHYGGEGKIPAIIGLALGIALTLIYILRSYGYI